MPEKNPIVTVQMKGAGRFAFELYPKHAPNAVSSVIHLAQAGAYNGLTIDRIVPGFVIQPRYADEGRPDLDYSIEGEFEKNGFSGGLSMGVQMVAMAGDGKAMASGSAFFISLAENARLQGGFTVIGKVIEGWDEVLRLEGVATRPIEVDVPGVIINEPLTPEIMEQVTVETFGVQYPLPVKADAR